MMRTIARLSSLAAILGTGIAIFGGWTQGAGAQDYPTRVIRIVSPHPPGIATDVLGRALAQKLNDKFGQPVILENRPGGNGIVARRRSRKRSPMAIRIHITTGTHIANAFTGTKLCRTTSSPISRR